MRDWLRALSLGFCVFGAVMFFRFDFTGAALSFWTAYALLWFADAKGTDG